MEARFYEEAGRHTVDQPVRGGSLANATWHLDAKAPAPLSVKRTSSGLQINIYRDFNPYGSNFP